MRTVMLSTLAMGAFAGLAAAQDVQNIVLYADAAGAIGGGGGALSNNTRKVLMADIDNDGDLDVVAGNFGSGVVLHVNDGNGLFSIDTDANANSQLDLPNLNNGAMSTKGLALFDWDGDGDLDLGIGRASQSNLLMVNTGSSSDDPNFNVAGQLAGSAGVHTYDIAFIDVDGGGVSVGGADVVCVVANRAGANQKYRNSGGTSFTLNPDGFDDFPTLSSRDLVVADFNNDGRDDVFVSNAGNGGQANQMFITNGAGNLFDLTDGSITANGPGHSYGAAAGDLDGDGDADLVVANRGEGFTTGEANHAIQNNSGGGIWVGAAATFNNALVTDAEPSYDVAIGDLDNDGDQDVFVANNQGNNSVYMNNLSDDAGVTTGNWFSNNGSTTKLTHGSILLSRGRTRSAAIGEVADYSGNPAHQGDEVALANANLGGGENNFYHRSFGRMFSDLGAGSNTGATTPRLSGDGFVSPNSNAALNIQAADGNAAYSLLVTLAPTADAFNGGTNFVNDGNAVVVSTSTVGPGGDADIDVDSGDVPSALQGVPMVFQLFSDDPVDGGLGAMSNGLSIVLQN